MTTEFQAPYLQVEADNIPPTLSAEDQWVLWHEVQTDEGRIKKPPVSPRDCSEASTTDQETWGGYDDVIELYQALHSDGVRGIGFVLTDDDGFVCVDLDDCRDPATEEVAEWARRIVDDFGSYTEISPSGTGLHIIAGGRLDGGKVSRSYEGGKVEIFDRNHYATVTGQLYDDRFGSVCKVQPQLDELLLRLNLENAEEQEKTDQDEFESIKTKVLEAGFSAKNGQKFMGLWEGNWEELGYLSHSEADAALCRMLAFHLGTATQSDTVDPQVLDGLFRASGLFRPKWDELRGAEGQTYGGTLIERVLQEWSKEDQESSPHEADDFEPPSHWDVLDASEVAEWPCEPISWIVDRLIARGRLIFVAGASQTGKSLLLLYLVLYLVAALLKPRSLFGEFKVQPVDRILYLCLEDPQNRVQERLQELESELGLPDQDRLLLGFMPGFCLTDGSMFRYLKSQISKRKIDVIVVDTYQKATTGYSSFDDPKQSQVLHQLVDLTRTYGVTIIILDHVRKPLQGKPNTRISIDDIKGTGGKAQNADTVILMAKEGQSTLRVSCLPKDSEALGFILEVAGPNAAPPKYKLIGEVGDLGSVSTETKEAKISHRLGMMESEKWYRTGEVAQLFGVSNSTALRFLTEQVGRGFVKQKGKGPQSRYLRSDHSDQSAEGKDGSEVE